MASEKRKKAIGYGYVIADETGRIQHSTFRSNRSWCWKAITGNGSMTISRLKKMGFRCVPALLREHKPNKK